MYRYSINRSDSMSEKEFRDTVIYELECIFPDAVINSSISTPDLIELARTKAFADIRLISPNWTQAVCGECGWPSWVINRGGKCKHRPLFFDVKCPACPEFKHDPRAFNA